MTITQIVEIPADHRIFLDLPQELPVGKAKVELIFTSLAEKPLAERKILLTKPMIDELLQEETLRSLTGLLKIETNIDDIRVERLKKYDRTN
jgi:hypothetical protein